MKKFTALLLVISIMFSLVACSNDEVNTVDGDNKFPKDAITIICPWSAGGGSDLAIRTLVPYLEEELGTSITVVNSTGANGWIAWKELLAAEPDGYTLAQLNIPAFYSGYLDKKNGNEHISLDDFLPLCNEISDWGCLVVNGKDDRFDTAEEFIEYAKENELLAGDAGLGSNKHLVTEMLKDEIKGLKLTAVHQSGWTDNYAALLGGHIDVGWGSVGECIQGFQDGELKVLAVFAPERSSLLPDVPTFEELGLGAIYSPADRGFVLPAGVDAEVYQILLDAFEKSINNPEFIEAMQDMGQAVNYIGGEEFQNYVKENEAAIIKYADIMGWELE
jgi:tripartite-type tricarboxylate transporter receptor subunit TctC